MKMPWGKFKGKDIEVPGFHVLPPVVLTPNPISRYTRSLG